MAPRNPALNRPTARKAPRKGLIRISSCEAWAALVISWPRNKVPVTIITKAATSTVNNDPKKVSNFSQGISFSFTPLSTTALCWKNTIQGAMVVPRLAMRKKNKWLSK